MLARRSTTRIPGPAGGLVFAVADGCAQAVRRSGRPLPQPGAPKRRRPVIEAARTLGTSCQPAACSGRQERQGRGTALHRRARPQRRRHRRLNGISLYAPHVAPDYDFDAVREPVPRTSSSRRKRCGATSCTRSRDRASRSHVTGGDMAGQKRSATSASAKIENKDKPSPETAPPRWRGVDRGGRQDRGERSRSGRRRQ